MRSERALKLAIAEMYVKGVSTRRVSDIVEILCGTEVSSSQVSRLAKELDEEITSWKAQPVGQIQYLVLDATYESVRVGSHVVKQALLVAIGVDYSGNRHILDAEVANSEAEVNWRSFLEGLVRRGMHGLRMITSDDPLRTARGNRCCLPWNSVATLPVSSAAECPLLRHEKR